MIGIIGAMDIEVESLKALLDNPKEETVSGIKYIEGKLGCEDVVVAKSGVGKVFAAICTEAMIIKYKPEFIINIGVAGTLTNELSIGNLVIADGVVQHDMDTSAVGDEIGMISGINIVNIAADENKVSQVEDAVKKTGLKYKIGVVASGDQFVADQKRKDFIKATFGAIACEMEGASIGQVCYVNKIPFAVIRAISDGVGEDANMDYTSFIKLAAENSVSVIKNLVGITEDNK